MISNNIYLTRYLPKGLLPSRSTKTVRGAQDTGNWSLSYTHQKTTATQLLNPLPFSFFSINLFRSWSRRVVWLRCGLPSTESLGLVLPTLHT